MGTSRIEQLIDDIYEFIESCKMQPLSQTKVVVPKDQLYDLLDELRLRTPDEIKRYQKIIANRDSILADAEKKALQIQADAKEKASNMVNNNEIMQQAYAQANDMVSNASAQAEAMLRSANEDANQIRAGALAYANEILGDVQNVLTEAYESSRSKSEALINVLKSNLDTVVANKSELSQSLTEGQADNSQAQPKTDTEAAAPAQEAQPAQQTEDYDFDENTFLEDID